VPLDIVVAEASDLVGLVFCDAVVVRCKSGREEREEGSGLGWSGVEWRRQDGQGERGGGDM
jgi:hypothetical protein